MTDIGQIDKRLAVSTSFGRDDIVMHDPRQEPFTLYGVYYDYEKGVYRRMAEDIASTVNDGVKELSIHTAGGRVCFSTDADAIAISCRRPTLWRMPHMALIGSAGFDLYIRGEDGKLTYYGVFMPNNDSKGYESIVSFPTREKREILIHFPLYCAITELSIGLPEGASLEKWGGYKREKPIVFYGSSVTQGACANTPGTDYIGRLSRRFDTNYMNLGFSGSAKGEDTMMAYLASLDMSVFVYDYDYNAPTVEHLRKTHYKGYRTIRDAQPNLPIVICTMPNYDRLAVEAPARRDVIAETYERALAEGDQNVYFVDGKKVYTHFNADGGSVDGSHPNAYGFWRMAEAVGAEIAKIFGEE